MAVTLGRIRVAIGNAIGQLNRDYEIANMYGEKVEETYAMLADALEAYAREVRGYENHAHQWNDDDYCSVCGADGRA